MTTQCDHGRVQLSQTLGRADTPSGEIVLSRRGDVIELVVNGVFAMDSVEVSSELALADAAGSPPGRVLVGGLGLGYTAARLLEAGASTVRVVELAAPLIDWAREGITEQLGRIAADPRVELVAGDIADAITSAEPGWDAILLDVDNGPSFLIHDHNDQLYRESFLRRCLDLLTPGGCLVIWCETASPTLEITVKRIASVEVVTVPVSRDGREFDYALYVARPRHQPA
jgi:spermidine synthase